MSNVMRWRYGDTNPIQCGLAGRGCPKEPGPYTVEIGDLVILFDNLTLLPLRRLRVGFRVTQLTEYRVGVAMQTIYSEDSAGLQTVRVATSGTFQYPVDSTNCKVGELLVPRSNYAEDCYDNQQVSRETSLSGGKTPFAKVEKTGLAELTVGADLRVTDSGIPSILITLFDGRKEEEK